MLVLERHARCILTDSGGVQKEAFFLGVPCVTLREETEWPETVECGWNVLAGADPERIVAAAKRPAPEGERPPLFGDGHAAEKIVRSPGEMIHPTAEVSPEARIGPDTDIWNEAQVREGAVIGADCNIGKGVYIDKDVVVGDKVKIQNRASLYRGVTVEDGVFIGPHVSFTNDRYPRSITPEGRVRTDDDWEPEPTLVRHGRVDRRGLRHHPRRHHRPLGDGRGGIAGDARRARPRPRQGQPRPRDRLRLRLRPAPRRGGQGGGPKTSGAARLRRRLRPSASTGIETKMIPIASPLHRRRREGGRPGRPGIGAAGPGAPRARSFEEAFAAMCGVREAVAVSSGTAALMVALLAHGIGPGDEVITTPFTFVATANAVLFAGARPVFVDVRDERLQHRPGAHRGEGHAAHARRSSPCTSSATPATWRR